MFVKPAPGRVVHDPANGDLLPDVGREVEENQYWYRRLQDHDVTEAQQPNPAPAAVKPIA